MKKKDKPFKEFRLPQFGSLHRGWSSLIILVVAILFIAVVPSIFHMGRRVHFSSTYYPFYVTLDDKDTIFMPGDIYLKQGRHKVDVKFKGNTLLSTTFKVKPYLFFSYLVEGNQNVFLDISESAIDDNKDDIIRMFLESASEYSVMFSHSDQFRIRNIYSDLKTMLGDERISECDSVINEASRLISSDTLSNDAQKIGIDVIVPIFEGGEIRDKNTKSDLTLSVVGNEERNGINFARLSNGMAIATNETSMEEWERFISENPKWSKENKTALIRENLVDDDYMDGFVSSKERAMVNVSPSAVSAYCKWFSEKTGCKATLGDKSLLKSLSEKYNEFDKDFYITGRQNISSLLGGVWEMTSTVFEPQYYADGVRTNFAEIEQYGVSLPIELFGGSALNKEHSKEDLRELTGVVMPQSCAETVGFRVALYE